MKNIVKPNYDEGAEKKKLLGLKNPTSSYFSARQNALFLGPRVRKNFQPQKVAENYFSRLEPWKSRFPCQKVLFRHS
jgi:hypothetical protein